MYGKDGKGLVSWRLPAPLSFPSVLWASEDKRKCRKWLFLVWKALPVSGSRMSQKERTSTSPTPIYKPIFLEREVGGIGTNLIKASENNVSPFEK